VDSSSKLANRRTLGRQRIRGAVMIAPMTSTGAPKRGPFNRKRKRCVQSLSATITSIGAQSAEDEEAKRRIFREMKLRGH